MHAQSGLEPFGHRRVRQGSDLANAVAPDRLLNASGECEPHLLVILLDDPPGEAAAVGKFEFVCELPLPIPLPINNIDLSSSD